MVDPDQWPRMQPVTSASIPTKINTDHHVGFIHSDWTVSQLGLVGVMELINSCSV